MLKSIINPEMTCTVKPVSGSNLSGSVKKFSLISGIALIMLLAMSTNLFADTYSGGSGTSGAPYQIADIDDLIELSNTQADWADGIYFSQTADIVFNADETLVDWDGDGTVGDADDAYGFSPIGYYNDYSDYLFFEGNYVWTRLYY